MAQERTIFFAGGGTGGHLYPGLAVAQVLRRRHPNLNVVFLCTTRDIDSVILKPAGFDYISQPIQPLHRSIGGLLRFWKGWRETKDQVNGLLKARQPAAVLGLGGYAAGVAVKLASENKIPAAILNPDVIPGKANQYLLKYVQAICCQFEQTRQHVPPAHQAKVRVTGCPIRADILAGTPRDQAAQRLGLDPLLHTLTITGASQGAKTVNEAVIESLKSIKLQGWQILHLAGLTHAEVVRSGYREQQINARVIDFTADMADVWAVTDLCVSRAGASTCAELACRGIASILLPYPFHRDQHQKLNAKALADAGAALMMDDTRDAKKNAATLVGLMTSLMYDATKRAGMSENAKKLAFPAASDTIADLVAELAQSSR